MDTENLQTQGADDSSTSSKPGGAVALSEGLHKPAEVPSASPPAIVHVMAQLVEELSQTKSEPQPVPPPSVAKLVPQPVPPPSVVKPVPQPVPPPSVVKPVPQPVPPPSVVVPDKPQNSISEVEKTEPELVPAPKVIDAKPVPQPVPPPSVAMPLAVPEPPQISDSVEWKTRPELVAATSEIPSSVVLKAELEPEPTPVAKLVPVPSPPQISTSQLPESTPNENEAELKESVTSPLKCETPNTDGAKDAKPVTGKRHMSGAALRRMKHYMRIGLPREEARIKAQTPYKLPNSGGAFAGKGSQSLSTFKGRRDRQFDRKTNAKSWQEKPKDMTRTNYETIPPLVMPIEGVPKEQQTETPEDVSEGKGSVHMGIALVGYPFEVLSMQQVEILKQAMLDLIIAESGKMKPIFNKLVHKNGWLSISCSNAATAYWLRATIHKLKIWPGGKVRILNDAECYRFIFSTFFPNSENHHNQKILSLIAAQNGIDTTNWKIIGRQPSNLQGQTFLALEQSTVELLKRRRFTLNYGFGRVTLKETLKGIEDCIRASAAKPQMQNYSPRARQRAQTSKAGSSWGPTPPKHPNLRQSSPWGSQRSPWAQPQNGPAIQNECGPWSNNTRLASWDTGTREQWASNQMEMEHQPQQFDARNRMQCPQQGNNSPPQQDCNPVWQPPAYQRRPENDWFPPRNF